MNLLLLVGTVCIGVVCAGMAMSVLFISAAVLIDTIRERKDR